MKLTKRIFGIITIAQLLFALTIFAQEERPSFFDKDFAKKGFFGGGSSKQAQEEKKVPSETIVDEVKKEESGIKPDPVNSDSAISAARGATTTRANDVSEKINRLRDMLGTVKNNGQNTESAVDGDSSPEINLQDSAKSQDTSKSVENGSLANEEVKPISPAYLSLFVASEPKSSLIRNLNILVDLYVRKNVNLNEVFIVTGSPDKNSVLEDSNVTDILQKVWKKRPLLVSEILEVPSSYQATKSPLWVIRARNVDHLFEGGYEVSQLFDRDGNFLRPK